MNVIFGIVLTLSTIILIFKSPESVLTAMLSGGEKALNLSIKMVVVYAVWMGVFSLLEQSGLSNKFAKMLKPLNKFLFGKVPDRANDFMSLNISANALNCMPLGNRTISP